MRIKFYFFGKKSEYLTLEKEYLKRLNFKHQFELIPLSPSGNKDSIIAKKQESESLLSRINTSDYLVAFDERGAKLDSIEYAAVFDQAQDSSRDLVLVMGGAAGLDGSVLERANKVTSFGSMVWTKNLFRLMVLEQTYRAFEIKSGSGFHKI